MKKISRINYFSVSLIKHIRLSWFLVSQLGGLASFTPSLSVLAPRVRMSTANGYRQGTWPCLLGPGQGGVERISTGDKIHLKFRNNNDGIVTYKLFVLFPLFF